MSPIRDTLPPDRVAPRRLSSTLKRGWLPALLLASAATAAVIGEQMAPGGAEAPAPTTALPPVAATDPVRGALSSWYRLTQSDQLPFAEYVAFLSAHPGWPGDAAMRRAAERRIDPLYAQPGQVIAFFAGRPPVTGAGRVRLAEALAASGRADEARTAAVAAWTGGALSTEDEARLLGRFPGLFNATDQDQRMERLLWDGSTGAAQRQLALVSPARRPIYAARLALQTRAADAGSAVAALGSGADRDPGFLTDRANWLRDSAQSPAMRAFLAQPRTLDAAPLVPEKYLNTLLNGATGAAKDGQNDLALAIARQADAAFARGSDLRAQAFPARDAYTSLVWLGGQTALKKLNRPNDAIALFVNYSRASQSPASQAKGLYWAGRAAQAAGNATAANGWYAQAAAHPDQFYGQLATERLGRPVSLPPEPPAPPIPDGIRSAFYNREVVRAARLLGMDGRWQDQTAFVRQIAADAKTDVDHALAGELARGMGRPDLGVIVSRNARQSGTPDPVRIGFPTISVPPTMQSHWTIVHAITRQESQFDRQATSRTGAKGMMQLMPATAAEQAGKLGLSHDPSRLIEPGYNVTLGSAFFDRLLERYNGNYVLAVAAYNAGPGNVNRFVRENGDPRMPGVDVVDWIEAIPFTETRGYVQRVLENAVVYDLLNPGRARTPVQNRLSYYLGKQQPG